jgi:hypothetical protein
VSGVSFRQNYLGRRQVTSGNKAVRKSDLRLHEDGEGELEMDMLDVVDPMERRSSVIAR